MTPQEIIAAITDAAKALLDAAVSEKDPIIRADLAQRAASAYKVKIDFMFVFPETIPDLNEAFIDLNNLSRAVAISKEQPKGENHDV